MKLFLSGMVLGSFFFAGVAWATKSVEVTFYRSPTPTVWCYLSDSGSLVECIDDPCSGYRYEANRLREETNRLKEEADGLRDEANRYRAEANRLRQRR